MLSTDLKTGTIFKHKDAPHVVIKYEHSKVARGGGTVRVRSRNLITGQVSEQGYLASAKVEDADVMRKNAQYLYQDGDSYLFMDPDTYEQVSISADVLGDSASFLMEGVKVQVLYFEGNPVSVELPITMVFEVTYTEPGHKGNTVSNVMKDATLENGVVVKVPTFVKIGDKVKVDTRDGTYVSKA